MRTKIISVIVSIVCILATVGTLGAAGRNIQNAENIDSTPAVGGKLTYKTAGYEQYQQASEYDHFRAVDGGCIVVRERALNDDSFGFGEGSVGWFVCFTDSAADPLAPICRKNGCTHDSTKCDAYTPSQELGLYNDRLYYAHLADIGYEIFSMDRNGRDRTTVTKIDLSPRDNFSKYVFADGYFYLVVKYDGDDRVWLMRTELSEGAQPEYYDTTSVSAIATVVVPTDGVVYALSENNRGEKGIYRFTRDNAPQLALKGNYPDNGAFYQTDKVQFCKYIRDNIFGFYEWNAITDELVCRKEFEVDTGCCSVKYDGEYIYVEWLLTGEREEDSSSLRAFCVYNGDYELIDRIAMPFKAEARFSTMVVVTDKQILFSNELWANKAVYYLNKSDIGQKLSFHEVS